MTETADYTPPKVWTWNKENGGRFASINRPIAGPTHDKELPVGRHPLQLHSMATPNGQKVTVMLEELLALGHAGPAADAVWPKVTSYPTLAELAVALRHPVEPWMLQLDPAGGGGYVRDWQPPGLPPLRHFSYAIQWWGFAVTLLVIWGIMSARREEPQLPP